MKGLGPSLSPGEPMSTYRLETLFAPRSVAVVGASPRQTSTGRAVLENLLGSGFPGAIHLVNPRYDEIASSAPSNPTMRCRSARRRRYRGAAGCGARCGCRRRAQRHRSRHHHHRRARPWPRLARRCLREERPRRRHALGRPQLPRRAGAGAKLNASFAARRRRPAILR